MSPELFSIIVLIVMFVVGTVWPINLGVMGFVAAFLVGTLLGNLSVNTIFDGFPANLFILLAGVTLLFAIAQKNGTIATKATGPRSAGGRASDSAAPESRQIARETRSGSRSGAKREARRSPGRASGSCP